MYTDIEAKVASNKGLLPLSEGLAAPLHALKAEYAKPLTSKKPPDKNINWGVSPSTVSNSMDLLVKMESENLPHYKYSLEILFRILVIMLNPQIGIEYMSFIRGLISKTISKK